MFLLTKTAFWRMNMLRWLKVVPLALAIVALGVVAISCNSGGNALVRVVNAIPNNGANGATTVDVYVNGTKDYPNLAFGNAYPTPTNTGAQYLPVPSGSDTIQAYDYNETTGSIFGNGGITENLSASTQYTALLGGFLGGPPQVYLITDNNTAPTTGDINIRVINGSATSTAYGGIDVAVYQSGIVNIPSPEISGLGLGQASMQSNLTFASEYAVQVFYHDIQAAQIPQYTFSTVTGSVTTVVIFDQAGGNGGLSQFPLVMTDLN
jgi:hypothetical protein